jgi:hypothetical protein
VTEEPNTGDSWIEGALMVIGIIVLLYFTFVV